MTVSFLGRHFDQVKRVEKSPKAKQGYALNELMQGIMNWLCHEFSLRSMNCPKGHCGGKSIYFFVFPCSYHSLGDLSTTLEMTVSFFGRHFDQVKRVEKSPKAKQYHILLSTHPILSFRAKRRISWKGTDLWWSLLCKWSFPTESEVCLWQVKFHQRWSCGGKVYNFFVCPCSYHSLGDLSTTLEMTVLGRVFLQGRTTFPGDSSGFHPSEWQNCAWGDGVFLVVISTKHSAWRNPLRRSSGYALNELMLEHHELALPWILALLHELPKRALWWEKCTFSLFALVRTTH